MKRMIFAGLSCLVFGATTYCGSSLPQVRQSLESNKKIYVIYGGATANASTIGRSMWPEDMESKDWMAQRRGLDMPVPKDFKAVTASVVDAFKEAYPGYAVTVTDAEPADKDGIAAFVNVSGNYQSADGKYTLGMSCTMFMKDLKIGTNYLGIATENMGYFKTEPLEIREATELRNKQQIKQAADVVSAKIEPVKATLAGLKTATKQATLEFLAKVKAAKAD